MVKPGFRAATDLFSLGTDFAITPALLTVWLEFCSAGRLEKRQ